MRRIYLEDGDAGFTAKGSFEKRGAVFAGKRALGKYHLYS
jgi:hypothetical protein